MSTKVVARLALAAVFTSAAGAGAQLVAPNGATAGAVEVRRVIVQAEPGHVAQAAAHVTRLGGTVTVPLPIVSGFAAQVPAGAVDDVALAPGVAAVTPDDRVEMASGASGTVNSTTINSVFAREVNADRLHADGVTGSSSTPTTPHVTVALVDTGVSPVPGIADRLVKVDDPFDADAPRARVDCVNLSGEATCDDTYGHGTFLAGLIAGTGTSATDVHRGVAPGARIVSIKIAGADGSADVSKVLAAIQWVVSFRDQYGIRVLNLSLGTNGRGYYTVDPLNLAVQRAWVSGVVVVVAASNRGPAPGTISKPGDDPFVLTVGAVDDRETPGPDDDRLPDFSGRGPAFASLTPDLRVAKPDVVAPGARLVSLRAPGSSVERVPVPASALTGTPYRRGSGTSMAAAVASGVAALVVDAHPDWHPNHVKSALLRTARKVATDDPNGVGRGLVDAYAAAHLADPGEANGGARSVLSSGTGDLDETRGDVRVDEPRCTGLFEPILDPGCDDGVVTGDETANDGMFDANEFASPDWDGSSWYESQWLGSSWYGSSWYGSSWYEGDFSGSSWYGSRDETAYGTTLSGSSWYGVWE